MKRWLKNILLRIIDPILIRISKRSNHLKGDLTELKKKEIISKLQSRGYGVKLMGEEWFIESPEYIVLGNNVHLDNGIRLNGEGGLVIGDNTHIRNDVTIITVENIDEGEGLPFGFDRVHKPVTIGRNVLIKANSFVLPGVTIGDGAIIQANSYVNRNIEPCEIFSSSASQSREFRSKENYIKLEGDRDYVGPDGRALSASEVAQFLPSYEENKNLPICFVLGTGRSGSTSIVDVLNQHPKCEAFHENIRQLIRISTQVAHAPEQKEPLLDELRNIFNTKVWTATEDQIVVHSDQRLWNLVGFLANYFPKSKFVHLVREPKSCIKSMVARGWYAPNEYPDLNPHNWAKYRLSGDGVGAFSSVEWQAMDPLQKCTWYWSYINGEISRQLSKLEEHRYTTITLDVLGKSMPGLSDFLGIPKHRFKERVSNPRKKIHDASFQKLNESTTDASIERELGNYSYHYKSTAL